MARIRKEGTKMKILFLIIFLFAAGCTAVPIDTPIRLTHKTSSMDVEGESIDIRSITARQWKLGPFYITGSDTSHFHAERRETDIVEVRQTSYKLR